VFQAKDLKSNNSVAVKETILNNMSRQQFIREEIKVLNLIKARDPDDEK
jgi:hypothetical protein